MSNTSESCKRQPQDLKRKAKALDSEVSAEKAKLEKLKKVKTNLADCRSMLYGVTEDAKCSLHKAEDKVDTRISSVKEVISGLTRQRNSIPVEKAVEEAYKVLEETK